MAVSPVSDEVKEVRLEGGLIRYRDVGSGPPLMFVHGIFANGHLWRGVVPQLARRFRCIVPDLPLGGHAVPFDARADLEPMSVARMVVGLLDALGLEKATLVGNDTGGAICQMIVSRYPGRVSGLVLTNCDAYEAFPPPALRLFQYGPRLLGARFVDLLAVALRLRAVQRAFFWTVSSSLPEPSTLDAYFEPLVRDSGVRRDLTSFLREVSNRYTLDAARSFGEFRRPVLIVWGEKDFLFPRRLAARLRDGFPDAALVTLPGSRTFVPEDQPRRLAGLIEDFLAGRLRDAG